VCLRLVRSRDASGVRKLCERQQVTLGELELARLLSFDLCTRLVLCATALVDSVDTIVGIGSIALDGQDDLAPDLVIVDDTLTQGLASLLSDALIAHAESLVRARAA
jgi:hypothetical protein